MIQSFKEYLVLRETSQYGLFDDEDDFEEFDEAASKRATEYEIKLANHINTIPGVTATRPDVGTGFSDILITYNNKKVWLEVKMNHSDQLAHSRVFYKDGKWQTTYKSTIAKEAVKHLNESPFTKKIVDELAEFSKIPRNLISIPTTKGGLKNPNAIPYEVLVKYFAQPGKNQYIVNVPDCPLGDLVILHYTEGKTEPAHYMQAGDDFYRMSNKDPYKFGSEIPLLSGTGSFKMRLSMRKTDKWYEVQPEIKIKSMPNSLYSLKPGTKKKNPFLLLAQKVKK